MINCWIDFHRNQTLGLVLITLSPSLSLASWSSSGLRAACSTSPLTTKNNILLLIMFVLLRVESGSPQPTLEWKREGEEKTLESHGGVLTINKVTRHMVRELENEQCQKETPTRKYIKRCSCSNHIPPHFRMDCGS